MEKITNGEQRRRIILEALESAEGAINATVLAEMVGVTRQVVVADVALLRASGKPIRAEHKGYVMDKQEGILKKIVCKHGKANVREEFYAVVDNGGVVDDVIVEHPIYGQICANLAIKSRFDAEEFIHDTASLGASQLSDLTGGVHIHTVRVPSEAAFERIQRSLKAAGILVED